MNPTSSSAASLRIFNISEIEGVFISELTVGGPNSNFFDIKIDKNENRAYLTFIDDPFRGVIIYDIILNTFVSNFSVGSDVSRLFGIEIVNDCIFVNVMSEQGGFVRIFTKNGTIIKDFGQNLNLPVYSTSIDNFLYVGDTGFNYINVYSISGSCSEEPNTTTTTITPFIPTKKTLPQCEDVSYYKEYYNLEEGAYLYKEKDIKKKQSNRISISIIIGIFVLTSILAFFTSLLCKYKSKKKNISKLKEPLFAIQKDK